MKSLVALIILCVLCLNIYAQQDSVVKHNHWWYLSANVNTSFALANMRTAGYRNGLSFNGELARFIYKRQFAIVGRVGYFQTNVDENNYSTSVRDLLHISYNFQPKLHDNQQLDGNFCMMIGPFLSIPLYKKRLKLGFKLLGGEMINATIAPSGVLTNTTSGKEEFYSFRADTKKSNLAANAGLNIAWCFGQWICTGLSVDYMYANEFVTQNVSHFSVTGTKESSFPDFQYSYHQPLKILNVGLNFIVFIR